MDAGADGGRPARGRRYLRASKTARQLRRLVSAGARLQFSERRLSGRQLAALKVRNWAGSRRMTGALNTAIKGSLWER